MNEQDFRDIEEVLGQGSAKDELDYFKKAVLANGTPRLFPEVELFRPEQKDDVKCTKEVKELRKNIIRKLMIAAVPKRTILEYCGLKFCISDKQLYKYFKEIHDEFEEAAAQDTKVNYSMALSRLEDLYFESRMSKDRKNSIAVLKEINEIQGLKKTKDSGSNDEKVNLIIDSGYMPDVCGKNDQSQPAAQPES